MDSLSKDRWKRIDTLFSEALNRPTEHQEAYVREACGGDDTLFEDVMTLLRDAGEAAALFGESVTEFAAPLLPGLEDAIRADELTPERIGPYRIVRELARGGMGAVYLAERDDAQYRQQVALKLVKRGMDTDEILRRFRYERQILAGLQHPNIARLLDGGVAPDGRPYLVMEYVEGMPIDRYCDAHRLDVDARLALFEAVCEAVRYAHQQLVVHRDLKPSNILVTEEGRVKLLDFGIAKLLTAEPDWSVPVTRTGVHVLTPAYASPEQLRGEAVSTATDVYALGIILYELLTGRHPLAGLRTSTAGTAPTAVEPVRPSTAVGKPAPSEAAGTPPQAVGEARRTSPERLRRRLRGDLDTIVLTALQDDVDRRYPSAEALRTDLQRHRAGLPIHARPDTLGYRLWMFVRRHHVGVGFTAVLLVLAIGFGAVYTLQIRQERDRAEAERAKAEEVTAFLANLFSASDPFAPERLDTLRTREVLDLGRRKLDYELADQPLVRAQLQAVMGEVYQKLGLYDAAEPLLEEAVAARRELLGEDHPDLAASLHDLAALRTDQSRYAEADSLYAHALALRQAHYGTEHLDVAQTLNAWGEALRRGGRHAEADSVIRAGLDLRRRLPNTPPRDLIQSLTNTASLFHEQGRYAEADTLYREALVRSERYFGPDHPSVATSLNNLAALGATTGAYDEAEALMRRALAIQQAALGEQHPMVSASYNNIGVLLTDVGKHDEAIPILEQAVAMRRQIYGDTHRMVAISVNNLGNAHFYLGQYDEAFERYREGLAINRALFGNDAPQVGTTLANFASALTKRGALDEAEAMQREALAIFRNAFGGEHPAVGMITNSLGTILVAREAYPEAEPLFREALRIKEGALPETHPSIAITYGDLGRTLTELGRYDEAETALLECYRRYEAIHGLEHARTRVAAERLVTLYDAWGRAEAAEPYRVLLASGG